VPCTTGADAKESLKGVHAAEYYREYKRRGGVHSNLVRQDKDRAEVVVAWYDGTATADERADFGGKTKERGALRRRVGHITDLIKERFYDTFGALPDLEKPKFKMKVPPSVKNDKQPGTNWISDRIKELCRKEQNYPFSSRPRSKQSNRSEGNHRHLHHRLFLSLRRIP